MRRELVPCLERRVDDWAYEFNGDTDNDPVDDALFWYSQAFERRLDNRTAGEFDRARDIYQQVREEPDEAPRGGAPGPAPYRRETPQSTQPIPEQRSLFDDIDR